MLDEVVDRSCQSDWIVEGDDLAGARAEHVLGVPVRRGDRGTAGREREGECAGGDLFATPIRRDEDVSGTEQVGQLLDRQEAVVEFDVVTEVEVDDLPLEHQAVFLAGPPRDLGMRATRDQVQNLRMARDDRRQRGDHRLQSLAGRNQAERGEQEARLDPFVAAGHRRDVVRVLPRPLLLTAVCELDRRAVRDDADLVDLARVQPGQQALRRVGHHDHALRLVAEGGEYLELVRRRLREDGVQRHDERLRKLADEGEHVLAVTATEDAVLVLKEHDVDVRPAEHPRRPDIIAARTLGNGSNDLRALWARRLVDDDDRVYVLHVFDAEQRRLHVVGEGANPARARRVR